MIDEMRTNPRISAGSGSVTNDCLLGATSLIEDDVYDAAGRFLGEIEEILVDARTGCVRYAVLALGGFLGIGRKRFAVPWSAFSPDADYRRCVVDAALLQLAALPVPQDDPWLRRAGVAWSQENAYLPRRPASLDVIPPEPRFTFLKLARPTWKRLPD